jgi:two-component system sensor histidine kinase QseC
MTTIRGRLLAMLLTGLALVLVAGGAAVYWTARRGLIRQYDAALEDRARTIAALVTLEPGRLVFASREGPTETIRETFFELHTVEPRELLKRSWNLRDGALPFRADLGETPVFADVDLPNDRRGRAVWLAFRPRVDVDDDDEVEPEDGEEDIESMLQSRPIEPELLVVIAALDRGPIDRPLAALLGALVVVGCVLGVTVAGLVMLGVRWGLLPLDRLSAQLGHVDATTLSERFDDAEAPCELSPVYRELNRMLDRVKQTLDRERLFADAAAHELRTPLTELRTTAEVAIRWPDANRAADALAETLAVGREMERLVESLLLISRGNANEIRDEPRDTPIATIVHHCLERSAGALAEKNLHLTVNLGERDVLRAPRDAVEIILRNLIDNAVQYTPTDGRIAIRSDGSRNGSVRVLIENHPVELSAEELPRLFEPFWKSEAARSDREHVGLGLAVVEQVAHAIGLRVDVGLNSGRLQISVFASGSTEANENTPSARKGVHEVDRCAAPPS